MNIANVKNIKEFLEISKNIIKSKEYQQLKNYSHHGRFTVYSHSLHVAYFCYIKGIGRKDIDIYSLVRAALLHDYFLYDWHYRIHRHGLHGYTHPKVALKRAREIYDINDIEANAILSHMWPLTFFSFPKSKEAWILCMMDKKSTAYEKKFKAIKKKTYFKRKNNSDISLKEYKELIVDTHRIIKNRTQLYYSNKDNYGLFLRYRKFGMTYIYVGFFNDIDDDVKYEIGSLIIQSTKGKRAYIFVKKSNQKLIKYLKELLSNKDEKYSYKIDENDVYFSAYVDRKKGKK